MLTLPDERQHMRVDLVGPVPVVKGLDARHEVGEIVPAKRPLAVSNRPDQLSVALCVQAHDPHEPRWHPPEPTTQRFGDAVCNRIAHRREEVEHHDAVIAGQVRCRAG